MWVQFMGLIENEGLWEGSVWVHFLRFCSGCVAKLKGFVEVLCRFSLVVLVGFSFN